MSYWNPTLASAESPESPGSTLVGLFTPSSKDRAFLFLLLVLFLLCYLSLFGLLVVTWPGKAKGMPTLKLHQMSNHTFKSLVVKPWAWCTKLHHQPLGNSSKWTLTNQKYNVNDTHYTTWFTWNNGATPAKLYDAKVLIWGWRAAWARAQSPMESMREHPGVSPTQFHPGVSPITCHPQYTI